MRQVAAAAVVRDGRVLAARRVGPPAVAGLWEFPGGKVELGETARAAAQRELREELRLQVEVHAELRPEVGTWWQINPGLRLRLYWATTSGEPDPTGSHDEIRWLAVDELHEVEWLPADHVIIEQIQRTGLPESGRD